MKNRTLLQDVLDFLKWMKTFQFWIRMALLVFIALGSALSAIITYFLFYQWYIPKICHVFDVNVQYPIPEMSNYFMKDPIREAFNMNSNGKDVYACAVIPMQANYQYGFPHHVEEHSNSIQVLLPLKFESILIYTDFGALSRIRY